MAFFAVTPPYRLIYEVNLAIMMAIRIVGILEPVVNLGGIGGQKTISIFWTI